MEGGWEIPLSLSDCSERERGIYRRDFISFLKRKRFKKTRMLLAGTRRYLWGIFISISGLAVQHCGYSVLKPKYSIFKPCSFLFRRTVN